VRGFGGGFKAAHGDSGRMHKKSQQYLAQSQDKDGHEGKNIQVLHHGNTPVWIRNLDAYQDKFQQSSDVPHAVSEATHVCMLG